MLGLGACLLLRARGADTWAAFALGAALLHTAQPRGLQGAALPRRGRVRAGGRLARARPARRPAAPDAVDRRRVPRRRDGDRRPAAAERLRLGVADAAGAAARRRLRARRRRDRRRGRARRARRDRRARASSASSRSSGSCCSGRRGATRPRRPRRRRCAMRAAVVFLAARLRRARARARAALRPARRARALAGGARRRRSASTCRAPARCRRSGSRSCSSALTGVLVAPARDRRAPRPRRPGRAASSSSRALDWTSAGFTKPLRLVLEVVLRPQREIDGAQRRAASSRRSRTRGHVPHLIDERVYRAARAARRSPAAGQARRLQSGRLGTYVVYLVGLVARAARRRPARGDRMSGATAAARRGAARRRHRCSRRSCPGSSSTGRRGSRAGAGRRRFSPTASCGGCGARAPSRSRARASSTGSRRRSPRRALAAAVLLVPVAADARRLGRRPRRARARRAARARAVRRRGRVVGRRATASR